MKQKLKNLFLVFVMVVASFSLAACKKGKKDSSNEKDTPTVNASIASREYYENEKLSDIEIMISEGDTEGTISWKNKDYVLVIGENECEWKFSPKDDDEYKSKSGSITITAVKEKQNPIVNPVVSNAKVYAENKLSAVTLSQPQTDTPGTFTWINPDMILVAGENECSWKFVPADAENFKELTGKITVTAVAQQVASVSVKTNPTKTSYKAFESFADVGLSLTANYDGGKVETITEGWTVSYLNGTKLQAGDTKVVITYASKTCDVLISVSKIEIAKPQVQGTYVYDGTNKTAVLKADTNANLYTVSNNVYKNAGTHAVTVTIKDFVNYKWVGETTKATTISFVISKAEQTISKNPYTGIFDANAHTATVTSNVSTEIYYSTTKLTAQNYKTAGSKTTVQISNAGNHKIYFYVVGNNNYNDISGDVAVSISKASSRVVAENAYSYAGELSSSINMESVCVYGLNDAILEKTDLIEITYYTDSSKQTKTNADNGATARGGAPNKAGDYVAVVKYKGSTNYAESTTDVSLVVDAEDLSLFAVSGQDAYAWRNVVTFASTKATEYVTGYFEVQKTHNGYVYELSACLKLADYYEGVVVTEETYEGSVSRVGEDMVFTATGLSCTLVVDGEQLSLVSESETIATLSKWNIPKYVGRYEKDLVGDGETEVSYIEIEVEYGEVSFTFNYRYKKPNGTIVEGEKHGSVNFASMSNTLYFIISGDQYFSMKLANVDEVDVITIGNSVYPEALRGDYTRV